MKMDITNKGLKEKMKNVYTFKCIQKYRSTEKQYVITILT